MLLQLDLSAVASLFLIVLLPLFHSGVLPAQDFQDFHAVYLRRLVGAAMTEMAQAAILVFLALI
jgi:hypothetical protein